MNLAWCLEPAEFGANLIGPLSTSRVHVNHFAVNLGAWTSCVSFGWVASCNLGGNNFLEDLVLGLADVRLHGVAHFDTFTVLDGTCWDISVERHEVVCTHRLSWGTFQDLADPVVHAVKSQSSLLGDKDVCLSDCFRTP